jgi:hypothetical protein
MIHSLTAECLAGAGASIDLLLLLERRGIKRCVGTPVTSKVQRPDPLLQQVSLPFRMQLYPLGFRLELMTNSAEVMEAARETWADYSAAAACEPVRLRVAVQPHGGQAPEPCFRGQGSLLLAVADRDNFAACDATSLCGFCFVTAATVANHAWFRWTFLESVVYVLLCQRYLVPVHAACVANRGRGVLLCGPSGAGKSSLAYACAQAGWEYLCDDATFLRAGSADCTAIGKPHQVRFKEDAPALFPELAGYAAKIRPNGRVALEVPTSAFPSILTISHCRIEHIVFLDRRTAGESAIRPVESSTAVEMLLADLPVYSSEVNAMHETTLKQLECARAWRITYHQFEDAIALLSQLVRV